MQPKVNPGQAGKFPKKTCQTQSKTDHLLDSLNRTWLELDPNNLNKEKNQISLF